ncbi:NAD(P)H-dependent oxidoreductase, partial [Halalkalibacterium halodurans]
METLFVKANDRENSVTGLLYEAFISTYKALNPNDLIVELDLFQDHMP